MRKTVLRVLFVSLICFLGCRSWKEAAYSYEVVTKPSYMEKDDDFLSKFKLISFGDYLFEYKTVIHYTKNTVGSEPPVITVRRDTVGVYLFLKLHNQFYEFDTFALQAKLLKVAPISEKEFGMRIPTNNHSDNGAHFGPPIPIAHSDVASFFADVLPNDPTIKDSIYTRVVLLKKPGMNTQFRLNEIEFPDKDYAIIGFNMRSASNEELVAQYVSHCRPLTKDEYRICSQLVKLTKQQR